MGESDPEGKASHCLKDLQGEVGSQVMEIGSRDEIGTLLVGNLRGDQFFKK